MKMYHEGIETFVRLLLPRDRNEKHVLCGSIVYYYVLMAIFLFFRNDSLPYVIMGYDTIHNSEIYSFCGIFLWNIRHVLFNLFYIPVLPINWLFTHSISAVEYTAYILPTPILFALSNMLIFRIVALYGSDRAARLSVLLFSSFSHVMLLSVQFETFPLSMLFLLISVLYINERQNVWQDNILFAILTGTTTTNGVKLFIAWLWEKGKFGTYVKRCAKSTILFLILLLIPLFMLRHYIQKEGFDMNYILTHSNSSDYDTVKALVDNFFSEPIFFHNLNAIFYDPRITNECSVMYPYVTIFIPVCIVIIYLFASAGIFMNTKKKLVRVMASYILVDLFILLVLGYGKSEAQLFSLHWIWMLPISIGLLLNVQKSLAVRRILSVIVVLISTFCLCYNITVFVTSLTNPLS